MPQLMENIHLNKDREVKEPQLQTIQEPPGYLIPTSSTLPILKESKDKLLTLSFLSWRA